MKCHYCYKKEGSTGAVLDMSISMVYKTLLWLKQRGAKTISISGGEPSLHPDFVLVLDAVNNFNFEYVILLTNGELFFQDRKIYNYSGIDEISFSIDSVDSKLPSARDGFVFDTAITKYNEFRKVNLELRFSMNVVLTQYNMNFAEQLVQFSVNHDFNKISFDFCIPISIDKGNIPYSNFYCSPINMVKLMDELLMLKQKYTAEIEVLTPLIVTGCPLLNEETDMFDLRIDEQGNVFPCSAIHHPKFAVFNILDVAEMSGNINVSDILSDIRAYLHEKNQLCKKCTLRDVCTGPCLMYPVPKTGSDDADSFCKPRRLIYTRNKLKNEKTAAHNNRGDT